MFKSIFKITKPFKPILSLGLIVDSPSVKWELNPPIYGRSTCGNIENRTKPEHTKLIYTELKDQYFHSISKTIILDCLLHNKDFVEHEIKKKEKLIVVDVLDRYNFRWGKHYTAFCDYLYNNSPVFTTDEINVLVKSYTTQIYMFEDKIYIALQKIEN